MKREDQICSLEQSNKLFELGLKLDTEFYWIKRWQDNTRPWELKNRSEVAAYYEILPAYTVSELGVLISSAACIKKDFEIIQEIDVCEISIRDYETKHTIKRFHYETNGEAVARADLLIWLIENKYIDGNSLSLNNN